MVFRGVVRTVLYTVLLSGVFWSFLVSSKQYCGIAEHANKTPCQVYFTLEAAATESQKQIENYAQPYVDRVRGHPWTMKAVKTYRDTPFPVLLTQAQAWVETEGKPRVIATTHRVSALIWDMGQRGYVISRTSAEYARVLSHKLAKRGYAVGCDWAQRGYTKSDDLAKRGYAASYFWLTTKALPVAKEQWSLLRLHTLHLAKLAWARIKASEIYNEWIVAQYHNIVSGPRPKFSSSDSIGSTGFSTAGSEMPDPTPSMSEYSTQEPAIATPPKVSGSVEPEELNPIGASPSETADIHLAQSSTKESDHVESFSSPAIEPSRISQPPSTPDESNAASPGPLLSEPVVSQDSEPKISEPETSEPETSEPETLEPETFEPENSEPETSEPELTVSDSINLENVSDEVEALSTRPKKSWLNRVARTVEGAISSMEDDGSVLAKRHVDSAKPEIMSVLRDINRYGDAAVKESIALAEELESKSRSSQKITREEVYPGFEVASRELAEMALKVRNRAEQLANDVLDGLVSVRQVTLDSLDDYFDVVLVEAAKQISDDNNEIEAWRDYSQLKQNMRNYRKRLEEHEFNMDEVNVALRESQMAAVVLVQDFNKQLSDQRARCQLVLQERDPQPEPDVNPDEASRDGEKEKEIESEKKHDKPIQHKQHDYEEQQGQQEQHQQNVQSKSSTSSGSAIHAKPAAYVVDQVVELEEEEPVMLPFDSGNDFEESDIIETNWEADQSYQGAAA